ncbi:MAG: hypothetical protein H6719_26200 [Sandaracinaceae bacterium]|nr:hypothetical protein [Sandaracinaceae bacterium]
MKQPHYLRFARALALAAVVPGCTAVDPAPPSEPLGSEPPLVAESDAATPEDVLDDAGVATDVDADLPFSSGPIVPPELPESFA